MLCSCGNWTTQDHFEHLNSAAFVPWGLSEEGLRLWIPQAEGALVNEMTRGWMGYRNEHEVYLTWDDGHAVHVLLPLVPGVVVQRFISLLALFTAQRQIREWERTFWLDVHPLVMDNKTVWTGHQKSLLCPCTARFSSWLSIKLLN